MACLTEFQYAVYADGELPADQARQMAEHLETCAGCRRLAAALRVESRVLVECLQATDFIEFELEDEALSAPQARSFGVVRLTAFVLAMSVLLRPVLDSLGELGFGETLNWLIIAAAYAIPAGITFAGSIWNNAGWIAATAILLFAIMLFSRRSVLTNSILSALALMTFFSSSSFGLDIRRSDKPVTIPPGETIDDTLVVAGDSVIVEGTVTGDLVAFVREVTIRGTVKGNVISFARRVELEGNVEGSTFGFAESLRLRGNTAHNILAFARTAEITRQARAGDNVVVFASESKVEGTVGKDVYAWAGSIDVAESAYIGGGLTARVSQEGNARIASGARIEGRTAIQTPAPPVNRYSRFSFYVWQMIWLAAAFTTGLTLFWLFPIFSRVEFGSTGELFIAAGAGLLVLVAAPAAAVLATITLIGLPLGLILLACWFAAIYAAKIAVAGFIGRSLLRDHPGGAPPVALVLLAGLAPIFIAINLPFIGPLINFLVTILGLGAVATGIYRMPRWRSAQAA